MQGVVYRTDTFAGRLQLISTIFQLAQEAASFASQLKNEDIDLHEICNTSQTCKS